MRNVKKRLTVIHALGWTIHIKTRLSGIKCRLLLFQKHCTSWRISALLCMCYLVLLWCQDTFAWEQMDLCNIKRKGVECQLLASVSCSALHAHYLLCAHSLHGQNNLCGSGGSSSVLMTTPHWPLQRKQMEPQGDVSISLTTWVS